MSPNAQIIAIAEACGWIDLVYEGRYLLGISPKETRQFATAACLSPSITFKPKTLVPKYLNDLNAIHEALSQQSYSIRRTVAQKASIALMTDKGDYLDDLLAILLCPPGKLAEIFLKTLNLWDDSK